MVELPIFAPNNIRFWEQDKFIYFVKMAFPYLYFIYFRLFNIVDSKQCLIYILPMTGSEQQTSGSEATALPTEPQPIPMISFFLPFTFNVNFNVQLTK